MRTRNLATCAALLSLLTTVANSSAQSQAPSIPQWAAVVHQLALAVNDQESGNQPPGVFPPTIPKKLRHADPSGVTETYNLNAPNQTQREPFFQSLGSNGRACVSCHEPRSAWGVSAESVRKRFEESGGNDPIFRRIDGATCDTDDVSTLRAKRKAYRLLLSKGLIRIFLPLPDAQLGSNPPIPRDYEIVAIDDPYGCTDLSSNPAIVSVYRRPLPSANLRFLTECRQSDPSCAPLPIMWDGREKSLDSQAIDATLIHARAPNPPADKQVSESVYPSNRTFMPPKSEIIMRASLSSREPKAVQPSSQIRSFLSGSMIRSAPVSIM
jgi:hypothetical protein